MSRLGKVRQGEARHGNARLGMAGSGLAWQGAAWLGKEKFNLKEIGSEKGTSGNSRHYAAVDSPIY